MPEPTANPGITAVSRVGGSRSTLRPGAARGASARNLRAANLSLVLRTCLAGRGRSSRADIASSTHMTRATVSRLVDELLDSRILVELSPHEGGSPGRPATPVAPRPGSVVAMGIQVNIGYLAARVVDLAGAVLGELDLPGDFRHSEWREVMARLAELARQAREEFVPAGSIYLGAALGVPGLVSPSGLAVAPNLGWRELDTDQLFGPLRDVDPVLMQNEANLAAFAVAHPTPGVSGGPDSFVFISGEVGIGAGIVFDHQILAGVHGWSGEIGHICVDPLGVLCTCGAHGCLETFAGQRAVSRNAGMGDDAQPAQVLAAARAGQPRAATAIQQAGTALGRVLAGVVTTIDVPLIIVGDQLAQLDTELLEPLRAELGARLMHDRTDPPAVTLLAGSQRHTLTGGAHQVLQRLVDDPIRWTTPTRQS